VLTGGAGHKSTHERGDGYYWSRRCARTVSKAVWVYKRAAKGEAIGRWIVFWYDRFAASGPIPEAAQQWREERNNHVLAQQLLWNTARAARQATYGFNDRRDRFLPREKAGARVGKDLRFGDCAGKQSSLGVHRGAGAAGGSDV